MAFFQAISLCNVPYKIVSEVLVNRLKKVINTVIDEAQSVFLLDKLITDNATIAFEIFHSIDDNHSKSSPYMALKLDMSKAFDRVEWHFLEILMLKMNFHVIFFSLS